MPNLFQWKSLSLPRPSRPESTLGIDGDDGDCDGFGDGDGDGGGEGDSDGDDNEC